MHFWAEVRVQEESLTILGRNSVFIFCICMLLWCSALTFRIRSVLVWWEYAEIECRCHSVIVSAQLELSSTGTVSAIVEGYSWKPCLPLRTATTELSASVQKMFLPYKTGLLKARCLSRAGPDMYKLLACTQGLLSLPKHVLGHANKLLMEKTELPCPKMFSLPSICLSLGHRLHFSMAAFYP